MFRAFPLSLLVFAAAATGLPAQVDPMDSLVAGGRVRVRVKLDETKARTYTGHWIGMDRNTVQVTVGQEVHVFPMRDVIRVERPSGRKSAAGKGALIGALAGGLTLGVFAAATSESSTSDYIDFGPVTSGLSGLLVGGAAGAMIGAGVGAIVGETAWRPVHVPPPGAPVAWRPVVGVQGRGWMVGVRVGVRVGGW